jgi:hypothetical protein
MPPHLLLYSTNTYLKFRIQDSYRGSFFAWCSPFFDVRKLGSYSEGAGQPSSSDPYAIYVDLRNAVEKADKHNVKIGGQKKTILGVAAKWTRDSLIAEEESQEIALRVSRASFKEWRPIIYVIPAAALGQRVKSVHFSKCASLEREYIIEDLRRQEFDIIEP